MRQSTQRVQFGDLISAISASQVWEYTTAVPDRLDDVQEQTLLAVQQPDDFPPIAAAIVPGDRIALAIDPNVPQIDEVVRGVLQAIAGSEAEGIEIVLWDEAGETTIQSIRDAAGSAANVTSHHPRSRESVRYLAADDAADPIYLNRLVVDADFVLPIVAARPMDITQSHDLTGIFPALADSATRIRHRDEILPETESDDETQHEFPDIAWLLGVQILLSVNVSSSGHVGHVTAGSLEAIGKRLTQARQRSDEFPPRAPLVVASLDGDAQQQSWTNAARAVASASRFVSPGGTIVLWTEIDEVPDGQLRQPNDEIQLPLERASLDSSNEEPSDFPNWDATLSPARTFARVMEEHRVLMHSRVDEEVIESMGIGVIDTVEELSRLTGSFEQCGVLRAAQFAGSTVVAHHRVAE